MSRGRTTLDVVRIAGEGVARLGMRFAALQLVGDELVVLFASDELDRSEALEGRFGPRTTGLRAHLSECGPASFILADGRSVYRSDLDVFGTFFGNRSLGRRIPLAPSSGVVTPVSVRGKRWGLLVVTSPDIGRDDAAALSLFATSVASALEVADCAQALLSAEQALLSRERLAAIGELTATLAHEVRNPLGVLFNSIASLRQLMRRELDQKARLNAQKLITIFTEETERLDAIVTDLLALARPTAIRARETTLANVVRTITDVVPDLAEGAPIELQLDLAPGMPLVMIDERLVRQALLNVVINALQAMPHGGTLTLTTRTEFRDNGTFACLDVTDTGTGIPAENHSRVFEPFFTTKSTGTGLGLPLVKRIIDAHRGELAVVSSAAGTTFTVRLPLSTDNYSQVTLKPGAAAVRHLRVVGTAR
ncbi:MAG TPA: ATP-binding protein [Labilithrix sp.]|nr:ATP-binding protein [Labilithrix sp.]